MAKTILKATPTRAIVSVVGAGAETIALATDILDTDRSETVDGTPVVTISACVTSLPDAGSVTITRGSATVLVLNGNAEFPTRAIGNIKITEGSADDVVVTVVGEGTVFLELTKESGYHVDPQNN